MTKEQFLNGTTFRIVGPTYRGAETFKFVPGDDYISKQLRSSIDEEIILEDYACNVSKVGRLGFTGYTHVMRKKVVVKYKFSDLVEFEERV